MKGVATALALGVLLSWLVPGCSASRSKAPSSAAYDFRDLRKDEIRDLWMQIRKWRVEGGLSTEPPPPLIRMSLHVPVADLRLCPGEPESTTETCQDTCTLKDAICDNAESICRIAAELGGDPWADQKCESAKGSCREARDRCCECATNEVPTTDLDAPLR